MGLLAAFFVTFLSLVQCVKLPVDVQIPMEGFSYRTLNGMAMYRPAKAPCWRPPGNGRSYIEFKDIRIERTDVRELYDAAAIQLVVIPDYDLNNIGVNYMGENFFCCTPIIKQTMWYDQCHEDSQLNTFISTRNDYDEDSHILIEFEKGEKNKTLPDWRFNIRQNGIHLSAVAVCDARIGAVTLTGMTEWMNPYGHLPGQLYKFLPFYKWMSIIYIAVSIIWGILNIVHREELLYVQNCVSGVFLICVIEMVAWYYHYLYLNNNGVQSQALFMLALMTSVSRRTISRMLVVAVSMGYGVVNPDLGDAKTKIKILGLLNWSFSIAYEVLLSYSQTQETSPFLRFILTPPVALIDGFFLWWIFSSLKGTIAQLKQERQMAKLRLFKKFSWCLAVALGVAFLVTCFQLFYVGMRLYLSSWQFMWILEVGFWQVLYTGLLFCIMILWRPSKHAPKYAHSTQIATEEDDTGIFEDNFGKPDVAEAVDDDQYEIGDESEDLSTKFLAGKELYTPDGGPITLPGDST